MKTKFFVKNKDGKIEFTEYELKKLLDEIYKEGYADGKNQNYVYTTPYTPYSPYITPIYRTTCGTDSITSTASTAAINIGETTTKGDK